jgi:TolB-like protein/DNA-binding winged helix-turn-helix (wHTH) protein/Tfp pilus assembly protein PilF
MESTQPKLGSMRTGLFEIDLDARELSKSGRKVGLQEQPFRVLKLLLQRQGALVTRQELQTQLWPADTYVGFDEGLNTAIRKLRTAFGDSADSPRFIETVPRRGYRFIAPVTRVAPPAPAATPDPAEDPQTLLSPPKSRRFAVRGVAALALLLILLSLSAIPRIRRLAWGLVSPPTQVPLSTTIRSLAVLPLENLSNEPAQEYFADGMTDQLITDLGQIKALRVISRTSIMQYKGVHKPIAQIARELNVDAVVEGTVMKSGNQVRITAQLIQAPLDRHLWARSYDGDLHDILSLQKDVASAVAQEIQVALTPQERALLKSARPVNPEAYEDYMQGRYFWNKRDGAAMERAIEYFQKATSIDPDYAPAYAGLAQTYVLLAGNTGPKDEFVAAGKKAAKQALLLDPNLSEAHTALALLLGREYNFADEEKEFKLAVALDPNYATAHHWYGEGYLAPMGHFEEANSEMQQALALDPRSRIIATDWGATMVFERRYDEAYQQLCKVIAMDSGFSEAYLWRGKVLLLQGKYREGIADLETAHRINPGSQTISPTLAYAYGLSGDRVKANAQLRSLLAESRHRYVSPWAIGSIYFGLGDKPHALDWFEKAVHERSADMQAARVTPEFDPLRGEPRFKVLLAAMKLPN